MTKLGELNVYPSTGFLLALPETGMWIIKNGYIKDIDKYLTQITERQDFSLNLSNVRCRFEIRSNEMVRYSKQKIWKY